MANLSNNYELAEVLLNFLSSNKGNVNDFWHSRQNLSASSKDIKAVARDDRKATCASIQIFLLSKYIETRFRYFYELRKCPDNEFKLELGLFDKSSYDLEEHEVVSLDDAMPLIPLRSSTWMPYIHKRITAGTKRAKATSIFMFREQEVTALTDEHKSYPTETHAMQIYKFVHENLYKEVKLYAEPICDGTVHQRTHREDGDIQNDGDIQKDGVITKPWTFFRNFHLGVTLAAHNPEK